MAPAISSPCIQVCTVDPESELCLGCGRTLPEIATWSKMTAAERDRVTAELPTRMKRIDETFTRTASP